MTDRSSVDFPHRLKLASPIKFTKIFTDNGSQFTDGFTTTDNKPSGQHAFDKVCAGMAIEHRLVAAGASGSRRKPCALLPSPNSMRGWPP